MAQYNLVVCGGTFDHFHKGHKHFLLYIFSIAKEVLIGVTTDGYVNAKKNDNNIESFDVRKASLEHFLRQEGLINRARVAAIDSVFYPYDWEVLPIEAIVVTKESVGGADIINQDRKKKSLRPLHVIVSDMECSDGIAISSSGIRKGRINREGRSFVKKQWLNGTLVLPEHLRDVFQQPFGTLLPEVNKEEFLSLDPSAIVTVGDVATKTFHDLGIAHKFAVVDFLVERKKTYETLTELGFTGSEKVFEAISPASKITHSLFTCVKDMFGDHEKYQQLVCRVDGEEDLAVLPVLLLSPLGFHVFYGQPPNKGIVRIDVTEEKKEEAYKLADRFILQK